VHCQIHQEVGDIESRRTRISDVVEVQLAGGKGARVDRSSFRQENELVEQSNDIRSGLVNGKDDCAVVGFRKCD
jgi:hypothetical protein